MYVYFVFRLGVISKVEPKKKKTENKKEIVKTGGGTNTAEVIDEMDDKVLELMGMLHKCQYLKNRKNYLFCVKNKTKIKNNRIDGIYFLKIYFYNYFYLT